LTRKLHSIRVRLEEEQASEVSLLVALEQATEETDVGSRHRPQSCPRCQYQLAGNTCPIAVAAQFQEWRQPPG
jgi:hypothetical protein